MSDKNFHLTCKDHLVSGEEFQLQKRSDFEILETIPKPENLSAYYESENYISHTDSSKTLTDKIYQAVKNFMLLQKLKWINKVAKGNNLLDIGAGTGDFLQTAKRKKWNVEGIEPNSQARKLAAEKGIELQQELSFFEDNHFRIIKIIYFKSRISTKW